MQAFINNWSAPLLANAAPGAGTVAVAADLAARLVDLADGDFYLITASLKDEDGAETAWEILKVTGNTAGVLTVARAQEGGTALELPAGTELSARLTAATLVAIRAAASSGGAALTRENFAQKLMNQALASGESFHYFDNNIGELVFVNFAHAQYSSAVIPAFAGNSFNVSGSGTGGGITNAGTMIGHTGSTAGGSISFEAPGVRSADGLVSAALGVTPEFLGLADGIAGLAMGFGFDIGVLSSSAQEYRLYVPFQFLGLEVVFQYERAITGANWRVKYQDADYEDQILTTSIPVSTTTGGIRFEIVGTPSGDGLSLAIKIGTAAAMTTVATLHTDNMSSGGYGLLSFQATILKDTGTGDATLKPQYAYGKAQLA